MNNRSGKRPGFTMIEMLTVIAVIAILAAILFPVFSQVKKRVHQASCINNMHQISQALNLYHDSNNRYPLALDTFVVGTRMFRPLAAQIKSEDVFRCPMNPYRQTDAGITPPPLVPANAVRKWFPPTGGVPHVCMLGTGPKSIRIGSCPSPQQSAAVQFPLRDSYDGGFFPPANVNAVRWDMHYSPDWTEQAASITDAQGNNGRQLKYRTPPATTVVTWCLNHIDNVDANSVPHGKVPVLFLDGKVELKNGEQMWDWGTDGNAWRVPR